MNTMVYRVLILFLLGFLPFQLFAKEPVKVIFETDMGNDIDDALALDMLYKYQDMGDAHILMISNNKANIHSVAFLDIMNTFYGYPEIPLATVKNSPVKEQVSKSYVEIVENFHSDNFRFPKNRNSVDTIPESVQKYRQILSKEKDGSVVIISVGFLTNLSQLLKSGPDQFSNLSGKDLVKKKVRLLSVMGGDFRPNLKKGEFNIRFDIPSAKYVFDQWPGKVVISSWEVGGNLIFKGSEILDKINYASYHPMKIAYENYLPMPYDRPTWDLTSVLYAIEPNQHYFNLSKKGFISVDEKGFTTFVESKSGSHRYLSISKKQSNRILKRFNELIVQVPEKHIK